MRKRYPIKQDVSKEEKRVEEVVEKTIENNVENQIDSKVEKQIPHGGKSRNTMPTAPPPNFIPNESQGTDMTMAQVTGYGNMGGAQSPSVTAVDPGSMYPCLYSYVYIWPNRGRGYWMYLTYIGRRSIAGWVWTNRGPRYQGVDTRRIRKFYC